MSESQAIRTAVVTGGHNYQVVEFRRLFRELAGIDAYVQHIEDFSWSSEAERDSYDAVVFYFMPTEPPTDDEAPYHGGKPKTAWEHLGETKQGLVLLHHGVLAYPGWSTWKEIAGIEFIKEQFDYHHDESVSVEIADPDHPITTGLLPWTMTDETYEMQEPDEDCRVLLTTNHPKSMRSLAWTRAYRNARVFCYVAGHDNQTWVDESFRTVLRRGIQWAARRM